MINVQIRTNCDRLEQPFAPDRTPRSIFDEVGFDYSTGQVLLDGMPLQIGQMDKSLADLGIKDSCRLVSVVKADCN